MTTNKKGHYQRPYESKWPVEQAKSGQWEEKLKIEKSINLK
jgi:hypothetical protein